MTISPNPQILPDAAPGSVAPGRTPAEQYAHAQHKAQKKRRKLERLLFFFGWCEGCRSYGNSV